MVLMALGALAYYTNEQSKHLLVEVNDTIPDQKSSFEPENNTNQTPPSAVITPTPTPIPSFNTSPQQKIQTYILEVSEFSAKPGIVEVLKDNKVNLVLRADSLYGKKGLEFRSTYFEPVQIKARETKTIYFTAQENFEIEVYEIGETTLLYTIVITIK